MKRHKKWLALGLALAMLVSVTACGSKEEEQQLSSSAESQSTEAEQSSEEEKEPVTLEWWYPGPTGQSQHEKVEKSINALLKTYPGMEHVTLNLTAYGYSTYKQEMTLALSADQQIDIIQTYTLNLSTEVQDEILMPMTEMLEDYPDLKNELPEWLWNLGSIDGEIYVVPNNQRAANKIYFITPTVYLEKYGDVDKLTDVLCGERDLEEVAAALEEYLLAVRAGEGETKYLTIGDNFAEQGMTFYQNGDTLTGQFFVPEGSTKVEYPSITDQAKKAFELQAEWYEKGYTHPDVLTYNSADFIEKNMLNEVSNIASIDNGAGTPEEVSAQYSLEYGIDVTCIPLSEYYYVGYSWAAGGNGLSATCEHPEEAMRLLELMNTEEGVELYNMVVYGVEDVHYKKIDDTHIKTLHYDGTQGDNNVPYGTWKWQMGNTRYAWLNQGCNERENDIVDEINNSETTVGSLLVGFNLDKSKISSQLSQIAAVRKEYIKTLKTGVKKGEWESYYDEYVAKLDQAGMQECLKEIQAQLDAFFANK